MANKDESKLATSKPKQYVCHSRKKKKPSKRVEPFNDNLNDYFRPSQSQDSQHTTNVMPVDTPKKSEDAKLKNDPDGSSHQRVDKPPKPPMEEKQLALDSEVSSLRKTHKSSQGSAEEAPSEPPSQLKQSTQ